MKKIISIIMMSILTALCAFSAAGCSGGEKYPVYIIIGQSNASGNGRIADLSDKYLEKEYENVSIYCAGTANSTVKGKLLNVSTAVGQGSIDTGRFGVEVGIAEKFTEKGVKAGLIKCGFDGASINLSNTNYGTWWTEISEIPVNVTKCYDSFKVALVSGLEEYKKAGYEPVIKGVIWLQGESNAGNQSYADDLDKLILKIRGDLNLSDLYFVAGTISYVAPGKYTEDCAVNKAIRALKDKPNAGYVESGRYPTNPSDPYHWTGDDLVRIGEEFAADLLNHTL